MALRRTPMARGSKGLTRRTGLAPGKGLAPGQGFTGKRKPLPAKRATPRRTAAGVDGPTGVDEWTRDALYVRCKGLCEACGRPLNRRGMDAHHRQPRRQGDHRLCNLVALHPGCHTVQPDSVHQNPARSRDLGLIVRSNEDPAAAVLTLPSGRRVRLDPAMPRYLAADAA